MNSLQPFLTFICVKLHLYKDAEDRDKKLIQAMAFMVYVSALLAGYAMFVNVDFLLRSWLIAFLIGLCSTAFLILHDQSLLATDKRGQVYTKILISLLLSVSFTLTNNADKEYANLSTELVQNVKRQNSNITAQMNTKIDDITKEEMAILQRIEYAGERINETKQPLIDARRSLKAFRANKEQRIQMIRESFKDKFLQPQISDLNILILQAKKFANGGEGTLIAIILAFLFFIIESLPAILRIMLDKGDYMTRYLASLFVMRNLRDQRIAQQSYFASADADILSSILFLEILDMKNECIRNGFENTEEMIILDQRQKILKAGFNPYTGKPLDYIDPDFLASNQKSPSDVPPPRDNNAKNSNGVNESYKEEAVFDL